jgi:hypothetical protein
MIQKMQEVGARPGALMASKPARYRTHEAARAQGKLSSARIIAMQTAADERERAYLRFRASRR